ncbi:MAG: DUF881 domain-containing protein [Clostridia bacterium]|nr:DUF881 domain-containing protein [Clostridia bacterium]
MNNKKQVYITIGVLCMLLAIGISIQLKTIRNTNALLPQTDGEENELRNEVISWKEKYDEAVDNLENVEKELKKQRELATKDNSEYLQMEEQIKIANTYLGLTEVTGKGIVVTLKDNQEINSDTPGVLDVSDYLVHDGDLIQVINELKNAGAEAISVNDQRIVGSTSIVCDGNVVRINGEKIGAPYIIRAIGVPEYLESSLLRPEGYMTILSRDGVLTEVTKSNNIMIPKYTGIIPNEYIKQLD